MYNFCRKTRGAVSILLIIILLPMFTCAGVFIDISRTNLAEEVVSSSADLALNTVLTDYDTKLKDYYGLLASCQDTSDVITVSKQYFADCLVSAGFETSEAGAFADQVIDAFLGDDDIQDMLQISVVEDSTAITRTANGAMDNPALIKEGIIEFMKYRAPINGITEIFEKITEADIAEKMDNASKESQLIEARNDFYSAEKALIKQAEKAYKAIKAYEDYTAHTGDKIDSEDFLNKLAEYLASPMSGSDDSLEEIYKDAHLKMAMNLYNTHNTDGTLSISLISRRYISTQSENTTYSSDNQAASSKIEDLIDGFNSAIISYVQAKNNLQTAWNNTGSMQSGDWPIQYWVKLTNNCSSAYSSYVTAANNVWKAANALENAVNNAKENAMSSLMTKPTNSYVTFDTPDQKNKLSLQSVYNSLWNFYSSNISSEVTSRSGSSAFRSVGSQISSLDTTENSNRLQLSTVSHIYNIRNELNSYVTDMEKASELLNTAKTEVSKLSELIDKYEQAFQDWKEIAFDSELDDSDLATNTKAANGTSGDRELIEDLEQNGGLYDLSKESVTELANRLANIKTLFDTFVKDIKAIKYNNKSILDVYNYTTFRSASGLDSSKIPVNENSLREYASSTFSFTIGTQIQRVEIYSDRTSTSLDDGDAYVITDSFHPDLTVTSLSLYEWLYHKFGSGTTGTATNSSMTGFDVTDEDSAEDADKTISDKSVDTSNVDTSENTTGHSFSEWSGSTLPSSGKNATEAKSLSAKIGDVSDYVSSLFSDFSGTFMDSLTAMRDDLFALDYIFSMFTYDTFDNEGCYNYLEENDPTKLNNIKSTTAQSVYASVLSKWQSSDENKTLTLNARNKEKNWCYGGEIEYILYGNSSNSTNKTTAYSQIYLIRYALNLSPVFQLYWDDTALNLVANALEAFAYIPASFTKTVACLAITAAESGVDIQYLKQGIPVLIYKADKKELFCNYQTVFMDQEKTTASSDGVKLQYSEYLKIFLYIKLTSDENQIYLRTGDVIQANMALVTGTSSFALSNSQVYYTLTANVTIEPMWSRLLAIDDLGDLATATGWRTISITMTRGY